MRCGGSFASPARGILFSRLRRPAGRLLHRQLPRLATAHHAGLPRRRARRLGQPRRRRPLPRAAPLVPVPGLPHRTTRSTPRRQTRRSGVDGLADHQPAPPLRLVLPSHQDALQDHGGVRRLSVRPLRGRDAGALPRLRSRRGGDPPQAPGRRAHAAPRRHPRRHPGKQRFPGDGYARSRELLHRTVLRPRRHRGRGPRGRGHLRLQPRARHRERPARAARLERRLRLLLFLQIPQRRPRRSLRHLRARTLRRRRLPAALRRLVGQRPRLPLQDAARIRAGPRRTLLATKQRARLLDGRPARLARRLLEGRHDGTLAPEEPRTHRLFRIHRRADQPAARAAAGGDHHARRSRAARLPTFDDRAPERPQGLRSPAGPRRDRRLARTRRDPRGPRAAL